MADKGHFLTPENPVATIDQRELEDRAIQLLQRPELKKARATARMLWQNAMAYPSRDQMDRFENTLDEHQFHYTMRAANGDAAYPKVARFMAPPHHWFGRDVPGSRWAGDSPDFIYRVIPIAHGGRYEIQGRQMAAEPPLATYALMGDNTAAPTSLGLLDSVDMAPSVDGLFTITIDDTPANGRANHLQTKPGADHLMIRDALGDWDEQSPNALQVRRLDPPSRAPLSEDEIVRYATKIHLDGIYYTYYCTQSGSGKPPNEVRVPASSGPFGGMATQWNTKGNIDLADDEALVLLANAAGARFRNVSLKDAFQLSLNYWSRTSSLNMNQMQPDADGRFTYVIAHQDPGIHNWLDTCGLNRTIFGHRWQAFGASGPTEAPAISARVVKFKDLEAALPKGVLRVDAAGRRDQIARREAGFKRRFIDS